MVTRVLTIGRYGRFRTNYVTLPFTPSLLVEQETPQRYFVLPDEPQPKAPSRRGSWGAQPRRGGREVVALEE